MLKLRHGDIAFYQIEKVEGEKQKHNGSFAVALGETTGHRHVITVPNIKDMEVYKVGGGYILTLKSEGTITHEEHGTLTIGVGTYRTGIQRERDPFSNAVRQVVD